MLFDSSQYKDTNINFFMIINYTKLDVLMIEIMHWQICSQMRHFDWIWGSGVFRNNRKNRVKVMESCQKIEFRQIHLDGLKWNEAYLLRERKVFYFFYYKVGFERKGPKWGSKLRLYMKVLLVVGQYESRINE